MFAYGANLTYFVCRALSMYNSFFQQQEKENAKMELNETNRALQELEVKEVQEESEKKKLEM